ncbi:hypothetical protein J3D55_002134 [Chryseobacterium ginsenosidimutans]|nr:hypothetical protein [Chryseobacterium ginsenosidimutans]
MLLKYKIPAYGSIKSSQIGHSCSLIVRVTGGVVSGWMSDVFLRFD